MSILFTVLYWVFLLHVGLAGVFALKALLSVWYVNSNYLARRAMDGHGISQQTLRAGLLVKVLAALLSFGMISVLGFLGGYIPFLRNEKARFFSAYSKEEMDTRVDALVAMAKLREQQ